MFRRSWVRVFAITGVALAGSLLTPFVEPVSAQPGADRADSATVAAVVEDFHRALAAGDSAVVESLLAGDAIILESGGVESRSEYLAHHLSADIAFARSVRNVRAPVKVTIHGDVAWAASTSTARGQFNGREVNSAGAELMVLVRAPRGARAAAIQADGWLIAAIHWSSRAIRP